jgi:hypothetical protein
LETPAAAKTRIRHCYNRPQTIRRLSSQKPILCREERQTKTHTQELKFQQLSHTAKKIRTHAHTHTQTQQQTNKQGKPTHQKNTKVPNQNTPHKKQKQDKLISLQTQAAAEEEEEEEEEEEHHHNSSNSQNTNPSKKKEPNKSTSIEQASKEANFDLSWRKETPSKAQQNASLFQSFVVSSLLHFKSCIFGGPWNALLVLLCFLYFFG